MGMFVITAPFQRGVMSGGLGRLPAETNNTDPIVLDYWQRLSSRDGQGPARYKRALIWTAHRVPQQRVHGLAKRIGLRSARLFYAATVLLRNRQFRTQLRARIRGNLGNSVADRNEARATALLIQRLARKATASGLR